MIDPRTALAAIGQLPDSEIDIAEAALQLAWVDAPHADLDSAREHLSEIARDATLVATAVGPDDLALQADALARLLGEVHGYLGDTETYDDPANANLIQVIERRRGLPVALGILWLHAARTVGWEAHGVDFPGHFLVALTGTAGKVVLDPFAGGTILDAPALRALIKRVEGSRAELRPGLLAPMSTRGVLLRLQANLKLRRLHGGDLEGALICTEDMLRIAPDTAALWREAALLHQRLDHVTTALRCLERFLDLTPDGPAAAQARDAIEELRNRLN